MNSHLSAREFIRTRTSCSPVLSCQGRGALGPLETRPSMEQAERNRRECARTRRLLCLQLVSARAWCGLSVRRRWPCVPLVAPSVVASVRSPHLRQCGGDGHQAATGPARMGRGAPALASWRRRLLAAPLAGGGQANGELALVRWGPWRHVQTRRDAPGPWIGLSWTRITLVCLGCRRRVCVRASRRPGVGVLRCAPFLAQTISNSTSELAVRHRSNTFFSVTGQTSSTDTQAHAREEGDQRPSTRGERARVRRGLRLTDTAPCTWSWRTAGR